MLCDESGFSLTELMVVIVVIGILAMISIPRFMSVATRAKMTEAKTKLRHVSALQQSYFYEHDRYSADLAAIGFESSGEARYSVTITDASDQHFRARATSAVDFDGDGVMNVWEVTEEGIVTQLVPD